MKRRWWVNLLAWCFMGWGMLGCATDKPAPLVALEPPPNANELARTLLVEGNQLFMEGRWEAARRQFQLAIEQQSDLAEAHYNLALSLDRLGETAKAKKHYIEAANLAPGHKVIWNSPPLRRYGNVPDAPQQPAAAPALPAFGGIGGAGGLGGGAGGY
ncbi:MAG: tetratricopeptide repeat protein [Nitrospira sp.]|nr:tetratricopeptide repeat protein [Nitrospira sp.]MCB9709568.1 tetratricopeptide repeat protein [Nitrospiraceae bacterium]MDR4487081.1 tetratricopeptide repeat protein [Nitrospirales bacterium]MCA9464702.1 tetratricopeptide repeat protein [Nitrospira sp.]MCA9476916.1 tetratricopeptide repeat protein [Nitrospira sp.]